jgi:predicted Zn-dependent peptidase
MRSWPGWTRLLAVALLAAVPLAMTGAAARASGVTLPDYRVSQLGNGLRVILVEKRDVPLIALHALLDGGSLADPRGGEGTAEVLAELLQKGAGQRDALEFSQAVDSVGGELGVAAGSEFLSVSGEFMSRDQDLMLELVADLLQRPALAEEEFEKIRQRLIQSIAAAKDSSPSSIIQQYFESFLFAGHPYGRRSDETSLAALTHDQATEYFRDHVGADRAIVALVGDFEAGDMARRVEARLGSWRRAAGERPRVEPASPRPGRRVLLVDKPDATQTFFWIGNVGVARDDPERAVQDVANTAFGGRFTSMLNTELRIETGLTYGARSALVRRRTPGAVAISSYTKTESTAEAIDRALGVLERLHADGLSEETLESVRTYVTGLFPLRLETGDQLAARLAEIEFYGLDRSDVDAYARQVAAASRDDVRRVISRVYPTRADLSFVLIARADAVRDVAAAYGEVIEMSITDKRFTP